MAFFIESSPLDNLQTSLNASHLILQLFDMKEVFVFRFEIKFISLFVSFLIICKLSHFSSSLRF